MKGYLGNAVTSAMQNWIDEVTQKQISEREITLLEKGFDMADHNEETYVEIPFPG